MSKHTPGPWLVRDSDNGIYDTEDEIANVVARGPYGLITLAEEVDLADARLIAAAPELLEALKDAQQLLKVASRVMTEENKAALGARVWGATTMEKIADAIAKAEGGEK